MHKLLLLITLATSIVSVLTSRLWPRLDGTSRILIPTSQSYIIALKPNTVDPNARGVWLNTVLSSSKYTAPDPKLMWTESIFDGFAGIFSEADIHTLGKRDEVKYIQLDLELHLAGNLRQTDAPWGLSRLSNGITPLPAGSDPTQPHFIYTFDRSSGSGVDIYVLDSGILETHSDFGGRAKFIGTYGSGTLGVDTIGHGTHVAGIAAGSKYGVAKKADIFAIKVSEENGVCHASNIISAVNLASLLAISTSRPSVINMSIAVYANQAVDDAIANAVRFGIPFVVAAGNSAKDAKGYSPARLGGAGGNAGVITVGATTISDSVASFSNFGPNVDVFAPGEDILSCWIANNDAARMFSGTSMAAAHVSGLAALIMGQQGKLSPSELKLKVLSLSVPNVISGVPGGTPNVLVNNGLSNL